MKSILTATLVTPSLRPKSELWIQHELDVAVLNAKKNRRIRVDDHATGPHQSSKKSVLTSEEAISADPQLSPSTGSVSAELGQKYLTHYQELQWPMYGHGYPPISEQGVEGHNSGINTLQTQFQIILSEWSCVIKQAIFHDDVGVKACGDLRNS